MLITLEKTQAVTGDRYSLTESENAVILFGLDGVKPGDILRVPTVKKPWLTYTKALKERPEFSYISKIEYWQVCFAHDSSLLRDGSIKVAMAIMIPVVNVDYLLSKQDDNVIRVAF